MDQSNIYTSTHDDSKPVQSSMSCFTFFYQTCQMLAANNEPRSRSEATPIAESIETPLGKRSKRFVSRLGDSFRRDAYLRRVVAAASVTWPIPRFLLSAWRSGASGGSVSPVSHGLRLLLYHSITMHAAETLVSSDRRGNARCTCSRLQPRLAPRNNTPVKHGGGSRARRIR